MDHIAIDLGSKESQVCVRAADGQILEERRVGTRSLGEYLAGRARSRVILETCSEAFPVADASLAAGHDTVVVPASLAPSLGVGDRGIKTDVRAVWTFVHAEGLSFKKNDPASRTKPSRRRP